MFSDSVILTTANGGEERLRNASEIVVGDGEVLSEVFVNDGETLLVSEGGLVINATVENGGTMIVFEGGVAGITEEGDEGRTNVSGELTVSNGGEVQNLFLDGGYVNLGGTVVHTSLCAGTMTILCGGTANYTTMQAGHLEIYSGGMASSVIVSSNGTINVLDGGKMSSVTLRGNMTVSSGGVAEVISVYAGGAFTVDGGYAKNIGAYYDNGTMTVTNSGRAENMILHSGGTMVVNRGGVIFNTTLVGGCFMNVYDGGHANAVSISGTMNVSNGGVASGNSIAYGTMTILSGGVASETTMSGGIMTVLSGGVASETTMSDGQMVVADGGWITDVTVSSGGSLVVCGGGTIGNLHLSKGGKMEVASGAIVSGTLKLGGNDMSLGGIAIEGLVFGGDYNDDGVSLSLNAIKFTDDSRVFGGADVSGNATASVGDITLGMEAVDGGAARVFGAGRVAGEAALVAGDIGVTISCADGGSFSNFFAGAEAKSGFTGSIICGSIDTVIDDGSFTYCGNGSQLRGDGTSNQNDSTLTINGGELNYFVYAGAFSAGGKATVEGDSTLTINGGTFNSHVFGGCGANNSTNGANTRIEGNVSVTVDASDSAVSFAGNLYAGSIGEGTVSGSTTMTFTGYGANLSFDANSYVTGGSQLSKNVPEYIGGTATLAFDGFSGDFSANVNNGFTKVAISDSNVSFTGNRVFLSAVSDWAIEAASADAELTLAKGKNSFAGDTLSITLADNAEEPSKNGWDVIAGTDATLTGWDAFSSVSLCGEAASYSDGEWFNDKYRLYRDGNAIKLAASIN